MLDGIRVYFGSSSGVEVWDVKSGSWTKRGSFLDRDVRVIVGSRDRHGTVFAGVDHDGVYRTVDGGDAWVKVFDGDVRSVAVDPNQPQVVYAGTEPVHVYRSEDGGDSWSELEGLQRMPEEVRKKWWFPRAPHDGKVLKVLVHPDDSRTLYLCLEHGGVVRSADYGQTWEDVSAGIPYLDIHHIATHPGKRGSFFLATARGFLRTDDPAGGWSTADEGMPYAGTESSNYCHDFVVLPGAKPEDDVTLVATGANGSPGGWDRPSRAEGHILRSDDGAKSWHRLAKGLPAETPMMVWSLVAHPQNADSLLAGFGEYPTGAGELYVTEDRGGSWERVEESFPGIRAIWLETA